MERINPPRASLTEGPVTPALRRLALPMALAIVFTTTAPGTPINEAMPVTSTRPAGC